MYWLYVFYTFYNRDAFYNKTVLFIFYEINRSIVLLLTHIFYEKKKINSSTINLFYIKNIDQQ